MGRLKPRFAIGFMIGCLAAVSLAESTQDLFKQGNAAYASGQFSQAASAYESARAPGLQHWALYYNLGNAYYKTGQSGKAVASYLRAFRLRSNQRDVVHNLNLVLTKAGDPLLPADGLARLFWRLFYILTLNTLAVLWALLFLGFSVAASLIFLGRWRPSAEKAMGVLVSLILIGAWFGLRVWIAERPEAVVVSGVAEVRNAPNLMTPANFTIPEGRRVLILDEQEPVKGWLEIGVPQEGLKGWVPNSAVEPL